MSATGVSQQRRREPWVWIYSGTAVVMTIAVIVMLLVVRSEQEAGGTRTVAHVPAQSSIAERNALLARFQPPAYNSRANQPKPVEFSVAIQEYNQRNFSAAASSLQTVTTKYPKLVEARFYLGICELLTGNANAGISDLRAVIAAGNTPYLEQVHFYLAKGLLAAGDIAGAHRELEETVAMHGDLEILAQSLLTQLR